MIDLNTLVSNALIAAVQQAVAPLNERIAALQEKVNFLEDQAVITSNATDKRIYALENNPAQGVDTQAAPITGLTRDEVDALIEQALDNHCATYDHDSYDSAVSDFEDMPSLDYYVTRDEVRSEIEDVLNNATLSLSI